MSEKQYENKIKKFLASLPHCYFFKVWGGGFQKAGIPDIIACINGRFVAIEVKAAAGKPSPLQTHNIQLINDAKGFGVITYPDDFEQLKEVLYGIAIPEKATPRD